MVNKRTVLWVAGAILVLLGITWYKAATIQSRLSSSVQVEARTLYVLTSLDRAAIEPVFNQFTRETGIMVLATYDASPTILDKLTRAGPGSGARADIMLSGEMASLIHARDKQLLDPFSKEVLRQAPEGFKDPGQQWIALQKQPRAVFVAADRVSPDAVPNYAALADAKWAGKVWAEPLIQEDPLFLASLIAELGEATAENWVKMLSRYKPRSNDMANPLAALLDGSADIVIADMKHYSALIATDPTVSEKVTMILPDRTYADMTGIGFIKGSGHREISERFASFMLQRDGQVAADVSDTQIQPITKIAPFLSEAESLGERVGWVSSLTDADKEISQ